MSSDAPDPARDRERFAERLREADLYDQRFIDVLDGEKGTRTPEHQKPRNWRAADDPNLSGNYGVHPGYGLGGNAELWLVEFDKDDYHDTEDTSALDGLPETFGVNSPHTPDGEPGHDYYAVEEEAVGILQDFTGTLNPEPAWGEIKADRKYVVGPGSQLDGCTKEWCDECAKPDGGYYRIANDVPIATLTRDDLEAVIRGDSELGNAQLLSDGDTETGAGDSEDGNPTFETDKQASEDSETDEYEEYLTDEDIADALDHIPKDLDYTPWVEIAFAVHDYDDSEDGKQLFIDWSSDGDKWDSDSRDELDGTWKSASKNTRAEEDKITLGHLIDIAELHGWDKPSDHRERDADSHTWDDLPFYNQRGNVDTRPTRRVAADLLLDSHEFATPRPEGIAADKTPILRYDPERGCFEDGGDGWIHQHAGALLPSLETADLKEIANHVRRRTYVDRDRFDAGEFEDDDGNVVLINMENGVYNLATDELLDHSPEYLFRTTIPQEYDADAECPQITEFIHDIVPGDAERRTLFEWIGFCLVADYPVHRFLILHGNGRNGKSTYFNLVERLLSSDNVSGVTLETIAGGGFGVATLDDKLMNVDGETANTRMAPGELDTLKAMSGGDRRQVDVKHQAAFSMTNSAKLAFAANNPPRFEEDTDAIADRLLAIELPYRFEDDENADKPKETDILGRITTDDELSGLLNEAIAGLQRVRERGHFSIEEDKSARERFGDYQALSDSIIAFSRFCLKNETGFAMPKSVVYNAYCAYCDDKRHTPAAKRPFFRQLGRKGEIELNSKRPSIQTGNKNVRPRVLDHCWITERGIRYLSESAREETVPVVRAMHGDNNGDYTQELLLRNGDSGNGGSETAAETEIPQAERLSLAKEAISSLESNGDGGALHADIVNVLLAEGVSESNAESALDKLNRDGIIYQPADEPLGSYRLKH